MKYLVSQSEVNTWAQCEQAHYYGFGMGITLKAQPKALTRGNIGHAILAEYYSDNESASPQTKMHKATATVGQAILENSPSLEEIQLLGELTTLLQEYAAHYAGEDSQLESIAIEDTYKTEEFPFTPDMIRRHRKTGQIILVDHKFTYNFYKDELIGVLPQLPKYAGYLATLGVNVDLLQFNQIRWRPNAKEKFKRIPHPVNKHTVKRFMEEQKRATQKILYLRSLSLEEWENQTVRTANPFTCKTCWFLSICTTDLEKKPGRDLHLEAFYEKNTYGYNQDLVGVMDYE